MSKLPGVGDDEREADATTNPARRHQSREDNTRFLDDLSQDDPEFLAIHVRIAPLLQIPASLAGLAQIVVNLHDTLGLAQEHHLIDDTVAADLRRWLEVLDASDRQRDLWQLKVVASRQVGTGNAQESSRRPHFHGIHETNPVWCSLFFMSGTREDEEGVDWQALQRAYRYLQTWFLTAFIQLKIAGRADAKAHRLREAGLLLRGIHQRAHVQLLARFISIVEVQDAYELLSEQHKEGRLQFRQGYGALADLLDDAWGLSSDQVFGPSSSRRQSGGRRSSRRHPYDLIPPDHRQFAALLEVESRLAGDDPSRAAVEVIEGGGTLSDMLYAAGVAPEEFEREGAARVTLEDLDQPDRPPSALPPLQTFYGAANARARARVMEAQRFTTRLNRIPVADLATAMRSLDAVYAAAQLNGSSSSAIHHADPALVLETVLLMAAALVTGSSAEQLCHLRDGTDAKLLPDEWAIAMSPRHQAWIRPYRGPVRSPLRYHQDVEPIATQARVLLLDVWSVGENLAKHLESPWFQRKVSTYRKTFNAAIVPELVKAGLPRRWRRFEAFSEMLAGHFSGLEEGDQLRVAVIFGRDDRLAHVHHFYTVLNRSELASFYTSHMSKLWVACTANGFRANSNLFALRAFTDLSMSWVGNDRSPTITMLDELVSAVRARLVGLEQDPSASPIDRHNARATYTALTLAIVTGCRAVRTPFPDLTLVDATFGFASLHEKDTVDGSHARIVWLPPRVRRLIKTYLDAINTLWRYLPPNSSPVLLVPATKERDRRRFNDSEYELQLGKTIWFIAPPTEGFRAIEWTGRSLKAHLDEILPGRWSVENAGRHFLRSFLTRWNCSATAINAQLGHWGYGESPWMAESAFDPQHFRTEIESHLEKLLTRLGYE